MSVTDDGVGTNILSVTGADAAFFEVDGGALYLKAGTVLDRVAKPSYSVSVAVDDVSVGRRRTRPARLHTLTDHRGAGGLAADRLRGHAVEQRQQSRTAPTGSR